MDFNLDEERQKIKDYLTQRIKEHEGAPVQLIELGFQFDQAGWFCVFFDESEDAEPDGSWTMKIEENSIQMPLWFEAFDVCEDEAILFSEDGEEFEVDFSTTEYSASPEELFGNVLGETIRGAFLELKEEGITDKLNKAEDCEFGIEELSGWYGWPEYEDRKKENLV